ncbi:hypothetical protein [Xylella fastidiosa]|uniref:hypothetical protein n=2 Tax=Xylella fastidiosa TaxID=2371 RepID=UPI001E55CDA3|nr:hypothetical protein [Xylella fastidiosa]MDG5823877.1 hypothetical protein [Xylella fastidiosa subsp. pauca]WGZ34976.1 hypothetical protein O4445_03535 [Xylella fastidiosa subsp. pauca]WGZ37251.1 hypothetical protein O4443_03530 [Xylella fastidiosa subsp. pauca]
MRSVTGPWRATAMIWLLLIVSVLPQRVRALLGAAGKTRTITMPNQSAQRDRGYRLWTTLPFIFVLDDIAMQYLPDIVPLLFQ